MYMRRKNPVWIFGAAALCFIAVNARAGQLQPEDPEGITAKTPKNPSYDPSPDSMNLNPHDAPGATPPNRSTTHPVYPGIDHQDCSHQDASSPVNGAIDACSRICLSCHDGINAPETQIKTVGAWDSPFNWDRHFHPLGVSYDSVCSGNSAFTPRTFLPAEIILPEGKVGCESCHNLHSSTPHFLVFSNLNDALCLGCHIK